MTISSSINLAQRPIAMGFLYLLFTSPIFPAVKEWREKRRVRISAPV